ncbi:hypothetical protein TeGR_g159, partial [Tetraparma gracilis]
MSDADFVPLSPGPSPSPPPAAAPGSPRLPAAAPARPDRAAAPAAAPPGSTPGAAPGYAPGSTPPDLNPLHLWLLLKALLLSFYTHPLLALPLNLSLLLLPFSLRVLTPSPSSALLLSLASLLLLFLPLLPPLLRHLSGSPGQLQAAALLPRLALSCYLLSSSYAFAFLLALLPARDLPPLLQALPVPALLALPLLFPGGLVLSPKITLPPRLASYAVLHVTLLLTSVYERRLFRVLPLYLQLALLLPLRHAATEELLLECARSALARFAGELEEEGVDVSLVMLRWLVERVGGEAGQAEPTPEEFGAMLDGRGRGAERRAQAEPAQAAPAARVPEPPPPAAAA